MPRRCLLHSLGVPAPPPHCPLPRNAPTWPTSRATRGPSPASPSRRTATTWPRRPTTPPSSSGTCVSSRTSRRCSWTIISRWVPAPFPLLSFHLRGSAPPQLPQEPFWSFSRQFGTSPPPPPAQVKSLIFDQSGTYLALGGTDVQIYICKQWTEILHFTGEGLGWGYGGWPLGVPPARAEGAPPALQGELWAAKCCPPPSASPWGAPQPSAFSGGAGQGGEHFSPLPRAQRPHHGGGFRPPRQVHRLHGHGPQPQVLQPVAVGGWLGRRGGVSLPGFVRGREGGSIGVGGSFLLQAPPLWLVAEGGGRVSPSRGFTLPLFVVV